MDWLDYDTGNCSVQRALEVMGDRWSVLVLREVFHGVRRFDQIRRHTGMSESVLAARLRHLVGAGVLTTAEYQEAGARARREYRLTPAGLDLQPALIALLQWGDKHRAGPEGPALVVEHRGCDAKVSAVLECADGHRLTGPEQVRSVPGPGARVAPAQSTPTAPSGPIVEHSG
ncbi:helix-turn-helix domain-containing protein [Gordonia caeni]|uniref:Helix-turn-helix domain-containing protein n=1 Tax=Gordonia caeni TaxID=1007097 RepID=A0ABP7PJS4_9ACTN